MTKNRVFDDNYDDIINLPHYESKTHPRMSMHQRAAQFSPFAAVTGHDAAVKETERLTDKQIDLDERQKVELDEKLRIISEHLGQNPEVKITYFEPDQKKDGGAYITVSGFIKKIDVYEKKIVLQDGQKIEINQIYDIRSDVLEKLDFNF